MIALGHFSEMRDYADNGSIKNFLCDTVNYSKEQVIKYLSEGKRIGSCPRVAIDCVTGEEIAPSFVCYNDGTYHWCDYLIYHIQKYNIRLPEDFLQHIKSNS